MSNKTKKRGKKGKSRFINKNLSHELMLKNLKTFQIECKKIIADIKKIMDSINFPAPETEIKVEPSNYPLMLYPSLFRSVKDKMWCALKIIETHLFDKKSIMYIEKRPLLTTNHSNIRGILAVSTEICYLSQDINRCGRYFDYFYNDDCHEAFKEKYKTEKGKPDLRDWSGITQQQKISDGIDILFYKVFKQFSELGFSEMYNTLSNYYHTNKEDIHYFTLASARKGDPNDKNYSHIARDLFYLWGLSVLTLYAYHTILDNLSLGNLNENDFDIYRNKIEEFYPTFRKYLDKFMAVQKRQNTDYHDMNFS